MKKAIIPVLLSFLFTISTLTTAHADVTFDQSYGVMHYTRYEMEQMLSQQNDSFAQLPDFKPHQIKDVPSAINQFDPQFKNRPMDVWDNWPLKQPNGKVAIYHGYRLLFALGGNTTATTPGPTGGTPTSSKIYLFYQRVGDARKGVSSWHSAGPVFLSRTEGAADLDNATLNSETGEWSGSAVLKNGQIRLFYTSFNARTLNQTLMTAQLSVTANGKQVVVNHSQNRDRRPLFNGDGKNYETLNQMNNNPNHPDNDDHTLRDPSYVEANGQAYLVFEANTGTALGKVGDTQLENLANIGGNDSFQQAQVRAFDQNQQLKTAAAYDNGAIGIIALNRNYTVKQILKPLVVFNAVDDETERPSVVYQDHRWYLFTIMHGWHMAAAHVNPTDSYVLGFASDNLTGGYRPLNQSGLVLHSNKSLTDRDYTYSYNFTPTNNDHQLIINSYATCFGNPDLGHVTFAPGMLLNIDGMSTTIEKDTVLQQGQIVK